jgi:hypothetical protein
VVELLLGVLAWWRAVGAVVDGEAMVEPCQVAASHALDVLESLQASYSAVALRWLVSSGGCTYCCLEINACLLRSLAALAPLQIYIFALRIIAAAAAAGMNE